MKALRGLLVLCATILSILVLGLLVGAAVNGSGIILYSHGLDPIPDGPDNFQLAHGLDPIPDGPDNLQLAHGLDPIPDGPDNFQLA